MNELDKVLAELKRSLSDVVVSNDIGEYVYVEDATPELLKWAAYLIRRNICFDALADEGYCSHHMGKCRDLWLYAEKLEQEQKRTENGTELAEGENK